MNELKTYVESLGKFKVSKLNETGLTRIHAHDNRFIFGAVCNESNISGSIRTKEGNILYKTKLENKSIDDIKTKIAELCNMYNKASAAFTEDADKDNKKDNKQVLLDDKTEPDDVNLPGIDKVPDDKKVVVDMGGNIVASAEGEKSDKDSIDDIIVEDPVTAEKSDTVETAADLFPPKSKSNDDKTEPKSNDSENDTDDSLDDTDTDVSDNSDGDNNDDTDNEILDDTDEPIDSNDETKIEDASKIASDFTDIKNQLTSLADTVSGLIDNFDDTDTDNKLIVTGLASQLYTISLDVASFMDSCTSKTEVALNSDTDVNESISVAAKTDYIDMARGGINQARRALSSNKDVFGTIIEVLSDIDSELATQYK